MACYDPKLMECVVDDFTGALVYRLIGPAKYDDPRNFGSMSDLGSTGKYRFVIPCGKCLGCRIDYSREWANRMVIELQDNKDAIFVTLTYNNECLPVAPSGNPTLQVQDIQKFFKRLRKKFTGRRIRYYLAGEYGPKTFRPHYHAIIYGLSLSDFHDLRQFGYNELKDPYFTSPTLEKIWSNGFVMLSQVTYKTCAYVSRYVTKKHYSDDDLWQKRGVEQEFNVSSRKPGIGMLRAQEMALSGNNMFAMDCRDGVREVSLPKAFLRHCKRAGIEPNLIAEIMQKRSVDAHDRLISNLLFTEKSYKDFLETKEKRFHSKIKLLPERKG